MKLKVKIIGNKTNALFDAWTLVHISTFYALTRIFLIELSLPLAIILLFLLAFGWEAIETWLENYSKLFRKHFKDKECWANRYVGDPIANTIGFILAYLLH